MLSRIAFWDCITDLKRVRNLFLTVVILCCDHKHVKAESVEAYWQW